MLRAEQNALRVCFTWMLPSVAAIPSVYRPTQAAMEVAVALVEADMARFEFRIVGLSHCGSRTK